MELIETTQKFPAMREQNTDQKKFLTQIHVLQHSWNLSFHVSNICLITLNNIKRLTD